MRLILLGPPGAARAPRPNCCASATAWNTSAPATFSARPSASRPPAGERAQPFVESGKLVPDDLVNDLVAERFRRDDRPERFVMDGYPRTLAQAASFDQVLRQQFLDLTARGAAAR